MKRNLKALLICVLFVSGGLLAAHANAPALVVWSAIGVFGTGAIVLVAAILYEAVKGKPLTLVRHGDRVALKDGRDYRVDVTDHEVSLTHVPSGETRALPWSELTAVYVVAIDNFPIGGISFVLHRDGEVLEIPWDADGKKALLTKMQDILPGFDNRALIEASGMLQGFKRLWQRA